MRTARNHAGLRDLFVRLMILLPLVQALAPTAAAMNMSEDVWCRSVASKTSNDNRPTQTEGQCLVCIAFAIGVNSAPASPPAHVIPSPVLTGLLNPPVTADVYQADELSGASIRAPPERQTEDRIPAAFRAGIALA